MQIQHRNISLIMLSSVMLIALPGFILPWEGHIKGRNDLAQYGFLGKLKSTDAYIYKGEAIDTEGNILDTANWTVHTTTRFNKDGFMSELLAENVIHSANLKLSNSYLYFRNGETINGVHLGPQGTLEDSIYIHYPDSFTVNLVHVSIKDSTRLEFSSNLDKNYHEVSGYHRKTRHGELLELSYYTSVRDDKGRLLSMTTRDSLLHETTLLKYDIRERDSEGNTTHTLIRDGITGKIVKAYRRTYQYWD